MGRNPRSVSIPRDFARYLQQWWPDAEATGNGRHGPDMENTPGVAWELKTGAELSPRAAVKQAVKNAGGNLPAVAYFPPGVGAKGQWIMMLPGDQGMKLLTEAGYTP